MTSLDINKIFSDENNEIPLSNMAVAKKYYHLNMQPALILDYKVMNMFYYLKTTCSDLLWKTKIA